MPMFSISEFPIHLRFNVDTCSAEFQGSENVVDILQITRMYMNVEIISDSNVNGFKKNTVNSPQMKPLDIKLSCPE